jgi:peptidoglycan hydrolase CwlO-like protein
VNKTETAFLTLLKQRSELRDNIAQLQLQIETLQGEANGLRHEEGELNRQVETAMKELEASYGSTPGGGGHNH